MTRRGAFSTKNDTVPPYSETVEGPKNQWGQAFSVGVMCTDRNNFLDFPLQEYRITSVNEKLCIKVSNSVLPERDIQEMFY